MHSLNRHSYLQARSCGVNPRIINRCVDRARGLITFDEHDLEPPFNRLSSEQPGIPLENIDVTRRPLAFGRWALPKLRRELHDKDISVVIQALTSLCDLLHDPEKAYEAMNLKIPDRMIDLLRHNDENVRERTCMCLTVLAGLGDGREAILKKSEMRKNLAETLTDEESQVRMKLALCLEMIARFWKTADILVEEGFIPMLLENLDDDQEIVSVHLDTLVSLMYCHGKLIALEHGAFEIFTDLLYNYYEHVRAKAAACLTMLTSCQEGKDLALSRKLLHKLQRLLNSENPEVHNNAASAIMFCSVKTTAKIRASKLSNLPDRLVELAHNPLNRTLQIYCIKALTNICEHPKIRDYVHEKYLDQIKTMELFDPKKCPEIVGYRNTLVKIIDWTPMHG